MSENQRWHELFNDFYKWPLVKKLKLDLIKLSGERVEVVMPIKDWMVNGLNMLPGDFVGLPANVAGVFLAMMHTKNFTPATSSEIHWLKSVSPAKDRKLFAVATSLKVGNTLILIEVVIKNEKGKIRAKRTMTFLNPSKNQ